MRHTTAQKFCSNWHGGQTSAYYSFASTGLFIPELILCYLAETESKLIAPENNLHPFNHTKKDLKDLNNLKSFFLKHAEKSGLKIAFKKHPDYGYNIPYVEKSDVLDTTNFKLPKYFI